MSDVECPHCGFGQEINHDDGYGYEEGKTHFQECSACEREFGFTTEISYWYEAFEVPCREDTSLCEMEPRPSGWFFDREKCKHCDRIVDGPFTPEYGPREPNRRRTST